MRVQRRQECFHLLSLNPLRPMRGYLALKKTHPPMPRVLGGGQFLMSEVPLYPLSLSLSLSFSLSLSLALALPFSSPHSLSAEQAAGL